jgi:uncharacterized protein YcgI (DUF1989 family)
MNIVIKENTGTGFILRTQDIVKVIDLQGQQVADLFTFKYGDLSEWLSNGRSFDYNNKIQFTTGDTLYSNLSNPMLTIVEDMVGKHDFLFSPCSQEMFRIQYGIETPHPNCLDNIANALEKFGVQKQQITTPFNIFMNTNIHSDGSLQISPPLSHAGDSISFRAEMDLYVAITACAAGICNNHSNKPIGVEILCNNPEEAMTWLEKR